ncbi:MAG TPA: hypothetical protein VFW63_02920, partial [Acidimicrobiales bacterium]|nr:hypothetical protein [Acidimicrobiales bacterium]
MLPGRDPLHTGQVPVPALEAVLGWGATALRALPWRASRDPWAVLVSEVMAQQTGVGRVVPRYHAFLARFPDPGACAAAPAGEVVRAWAGLGYNRRALALHASATAVVDRHGGRLPDDLGGLLALPGVGPYTARAVLAFAHERPVGVVDTNVGRVLARWAGRPLRPTDAQGWADHLVASVAPAGGGVAWRWNQSVMELGGTVCHRRRPRCGACPAAVWCAWAGRGLAGPDPAEGSAGTSRAQRPFAGSDRQGRGRLVAALRAGPVPVADVPVAAGWPADPARAARVAAAVVAEGLAVRDGPVLRLPT